MLLRRALMQAIIGADDAAPPAAKRAGLRSQRGPDSKDVLLKCGALSKVGNSEQPRILAVLYQLLSPQYRLLQSCSAILTQ